MAPKPKASSKKAAPAKAATKAAPKKAVTKSAPDLFNQPSAPKKATVAKPRYTVKGTQVTAKPTVKAAKPTVKAVRPKITNKDIGKAVTSVARKDLKQKLQKMSQANPTYTKGTQGATKAPYSPSYKGPTRSATPAAKSLATRLGSALKGKGKAGLIGGLIAGGAAGAYSAYKRGTGTTKKKAVEAPSKAVAPKPAAPKPPVQSDLAKKYNRRDDVGKPSSPTVIKKPATPAKKAVAKKPVVAKRPGQIALAKGITAKDIKPSTPATIGKPEIKSVATTKPSTTTTTAAAESKPKYSEKRIERMENRAERKSERMDNRAERLEKRAGKLKGKLKSGGSLKPVDASKKPGLSKLPTAVRNKMGYQKNGGMMKAKKGAKLKKAMMGTDIMDRAMMKSGGKMKKCKYGCN